MEFLCFDGLFAVAIETTIIAVYFSVDGIRKVCVPSAWYRKGFLFQKATVRKFSVKITQFFVCPGM